jgi:hypothetical protein
VYSLFAVRSTMALGITAAVLVRSTLVMCMYGILIFFSNPNKLE